jgi:hypothetical protein
MDMRPVLRHHTGRSIAQRTVRSAPIVLIALAVALTMGILFGEIWSPETIVAAPLRW